MFRIRDEHLDAFQRAAGANAPNAIACQLRAKGILATVDPSARTVAVSDKRGFSTRAAFRPDGALDALIRPSGHTLRFESDSSGRMNSVTYPSGDRVTFGNDLAGRSNSTLSSNGSKCQIVWQDDERPTEFIMPDGKGYTYSYDAESGLLNSIVDRSGARTQIDRTPSKTEVTDPLGRRVIYHTTPDGWVESLAYPDSSEERFNLDSESSVATLVLRDSRQVAYQFDAEGRPTRVKWSDGTFLELEFNSASVLTKASNNTGNVVLERDGDGRVTAETTPFGRVEFGYDPDARLESIVTQFGETIRYEYDSDGRLVAALDWEGRAIRLEYGPSGTLSHLHYPNGVTQQQTYQRICLLTSVAVTGSGDIDLGSQTYEYDECERLIHVADRWGQTAGESVARRLQYDDEYRLIREVNEQTARTTSEFGYDGKGNMVRANGISIQIGPMDEPRSIGPTALAYDKRGNLVQFPGPKGIVVANFSDDNRVKELSTAGRTIKYGYDALGRRVCASDGMFETRFGWANSQLIWEEHRPTPEAEPIRRDYLYLPSVANPIGFREYGRIYWLQHDVRGAVIRAFDDNGRVVWRGDYDAFGHASQPVAEVRQPWRLAGQYHDDSTGLHYNLIRYYHPGLRTYLSMDPRWHELEATNYSYCRNDPWNRADTIGMIGPLLLIGVVTAVGAVVGGAVGAWSAPPGQKWAGAISGAVGGAVAGLADGLALCTLNPITAAAISTVGAGLGSAAQDLVFAGLTGKEVCWPCIATNAMVAMGINLAVLGLGAIAGRLIPPAAKTAIAKAIAGKLPGWLGRWAEKMVARAEKEANDALIEAKKRAQDEARKKIAARREAARQAELDQGVRNAEKAGKMKDLSPADRAWLDSDPRAKQLAYDPDTKSFKPDEARAALQAEKEGTIPGPVKRDYVQGGGSSGGDVVDGAGKAWDVKDASAGADRIAEIAAPKGGKPGESVLVDASKMTPAERQALQKDIASKTQPGSAPIVISPKP